MDEIGDMPPKMQLDLLRVLQEKRVRPVGGLGERPKFAPKSQRAVRQTAAGRPSSAMRPAEGKQPAVKFDHAKHATTFKKDGGAAIVCKDCHHTLKSDAPAADEKMQVCGACHVKDGAAQPEVGNHSPPEASSMPACRPASSRSTNCAYAAG